jgi:hypothetical protein
MGFARPDWEAPMDQDPALGVATRMAVLEVLAQSGGTMLGFHLPDGGIGRVERRGGAYAFVPA